MKVVMRWVTVLRIFALKMCLGALMNLSSRSPYIEPKPTQFLRVSYVVFASLDIEEKCETECPQRSSGMRMLLMLDCPMRSWDNEITKSHTIGDLGPYFFICRSRCGFRPWGRISLECICWMLRKLVIELRTQNQYTQSAPPWYQPRKHLLPNLVTRNNARWE